MPLLLLTLLNLAAGVAAALWSSRELRASPRGFASLAGFAGLAAHELLVVVPAAFYLLVRHTEWMVSYTAHGSRLPSALLLSAAGAQALIALAGFALGARQVRDHRPRRPLGVLAAIGVVALACLIVGRGRLGVVGTTAQFRGGFGLVSFWSSRVSTSVMVIAMVQCGALAHLARSLRGPTP